MERIVLNKLESIFTYLIFSIVHLNPTLLTNVQYRVYLSFRVVWLTLRQKQHGWKGFSQHVVIHCHPSVREVKARWELTDKTWSRSHRELLLIGSTDLLSNYRPRGNERWFVSDIRLSCLTSLGKFILCSTKEWEWIILCKERGQQFIDCGWNRDVFFAEVLDFFLRYCEPIGIWVGSYCYLIRVIT